MCKAGWCATINYAKFPAASDSAYFHTHFNT